MTRHEKTSARVARDRSMSDYKTLKPGERSPVSWRDHLIACCDCGLVHRFRFTVLYTGKKALQMRPSTIKRLGKELRPRVQFQAWRMEKETAKRRREKDVRKSIRSLPAGPATIKKRPSSWPPSATGRGGL